ncbi:hypothetical protein CEXT_49591 [Caerostris extrusa]|uniref:Uncharacterized protein n=1 Tax=Caerostris extrusa TaxID=172846 RepID=A0AAV4VAT1_CAEEX|nr:hypothetical protein CEXT_49591 [Caerostris extrusa]
MEFHNIFPTSNVTQIRQLKILELVKMRQNQTMCTLLHCLVTSAESTLACNTTASTDVVNAFLSRRATADYKCTESSVRTQFSSKNVNVTRMWQMLFPLNNAHW